MTCGTVFVPVCVVFFAFSVDVMPVFSVGSSARQSLQQHPYHTSFQNHPGTADVDSALDLPPMPTEESTVQFRYACQGELLRLSCNSNGRSYRSSKIPDFRKSSRHQAASRRSTVTLSGAAVIVLETARYGLGSSTAVANRCRVGSWPDCDVDVRHALNGVCSGRPDCTVAVTVGFLGRPCRATEAHGDPSKRQDSAVEFLTVSYRCVPVNAIRNDCSRWPHTTTHIDLGGRRDVISQPGGGRAPSAVYLASPNYPGRYPADADCRWVVHFAPERQRVGHWSAEVREVTELTIQLTIYDFELDVRRSGQCHDFVSIVSRQPLSRAATALGSDENQGIDPVGNRWRQQSRDIDSSSAAGAALRVHFNDCGGVGKQSFEVGSNEVVITFRSGRTSIGQRGFLLRLFAEEVAGIETRRRFVFEPSQSLRTNWPPSVETPITTSHVETATRPQATSTRTGQSLVLATGSFERANGVGVTSFDIGLLRPVALISIALLVMVVTAAVLSIYHLRYLQNFRDSEQRPPRNSFAEATFTRRDNSVATFNEREDCYDFGLDDVSSCDVIGRAASPPTRPCEPRTMTSQSTDIIVDVVRSKNGESMISKTGANLASESPPTPDDKLRTQNDRKPSHVTQALSVSSAVYLTRHGRPTTWKERGVNSAATAARKLKYKLITEHGDRPKK